VPTLGDRVEGRLNNFDVLRFALASTVLVSHSFPLTQEGSVDPLADLTGGQIDGGVLAVGGFFVVSGFLIAASWQRSRSVRSYARKRALRIYPAFLVNWLTCVLVVGAIGYVGSATDYWRSLNPVELVPNLLAFRIPLMDGVFPDSGAPGAINGSLWTLAVEVQCYVLLAVAGLIGLLARRRLLLVLFVLLLVFVVVDTREGYTAGLVSSGPFEAYLTNVFRLTAYFTAGTLAWLYRERIPLSPWLALLAVLALAATVRDGLDVTMPVAGAYLLLYAAHVPAGRLAHFGRRRDLSYGTYLWAFPVQQLALLALGPGTGPWTLTAVATAPTIALAAVSWYAVEAPALARVRLRRSHGATVEVAAAPATGVTRRAEPRL